MRVWRHWRYWLWLGAKIVLILGVIAGLWAGAQFILPPAPGGWLRAWPRLGTDFSYTLAAFVLGLLAAGLIGLCAWDQRFRCRVCARRLRLPRAEGVYSSVMLVGVPHTEYICSYGHGTLYVPDVHTTYLPAKWTPIASLWEDLLQAEKVARRGE